MTKTLGLKSFKRPLQPKITEKQCKHRLRFCKMVKNWTEEDLKRVVWSDETPFEVLHPLTRRTTGYRPRKRRMFLQEQR